MKLGQGGGSMGNILGTEQQEGHESLLYTGNASCLKPTKPFPTNCLHLEQLKT